MQKESTFYETNFVLKNLLTSAALVEWIKIKPNAHIWLKKMLLNSTIANWRGGSKNKNVMLNKTLWAQAYFFFLYRAARVIAESAAVARNLHFCAILSWVKCYLMEDRSLLTQLELRLGCLRRLTWEFVRNEEKRISENVAVWWINNPR